MHRRARALVAGAFLLAALPVREAWRETAGHDAGWTRLDIGLAPLVRSLPPGVAVGWLRSEKGGHADATHRVMAQYVMAPRLLGTATDDTPVLVGWSEDEAWAGKTARARGLRVLARFEGGYAVLVRGGP